MISQMGVQLAPVLSDVAKEVVTLERTYIEAALGRDIAMLDHILSDSFIISSPSGVITKALCIAEIKGGELMFESIVRDEATVRDYGDEAVVNGIASVSGRYRGADISGQYRYRHTEVFVRRLGRWQIATGQVSRIT